GKRDHDRRKQDHVVVASSELEALTEHQTPTGRWWPDAEPQETQPCFREDLFWDPQRCPNDHGRDAVWQEVAQHQLPPARPHRERRADVRRLFDRQHLAADESAWRDPGGEAYGDEDVSQAGAKQGQHQDYYHDVRKRRKDVDQSTDDVVRVTTAQS